jgi:hydrogenase nickel incorporation protein HypB
MGLEVEGGDVVLLSVNEGEDKPLKCPTIFNGADVAVITKMDLAVAAEFDAELVEILTRRGPGCRSFRYPVKLDLEFPIFSNI